MPARHEHDLPRRLALGAAAVAVLIPAGLDAAARPTCAPGPLLPVEVPTLTVSMQAESPEYRRGQLVRVPISVRALGPAGSPVADADVSVEVRAGERLVRSLQARTDQQGRALVRFRADGSVPTGSLDAVADARSVLVPELFDCSGPPAFQVGRAVAEPLVKITG